MTLASTSGRRRLISSFALGLLAAVSPFVAPAQAADVATPAPAAASRWTLPPAVRRSAVPDQASRMAETLAAQGSGSIVAPASVVAPARRLDAAGVDAAPNVFGSVALAVSSTPLDGKWQAAGGTSAAGLGRWTATFPKASGGDEALLGEVNRWVNARVRFTDDHARGSTDRWADAAETLGRGQGDCEDYALAKLQMLSALGFDSRRLFFVVVRDLVRRADHAVLVAQVGNRYLVLDNMTDAVLDSNQVGDYRPVISYSAAGRWVHGYERSPAQEPVRVAALDGTVAP